jgi:hypothetical protein
VRSAVKGIDGSEIVKAYALEHPARREGSRANFSNHTLSGFRQEFEHNFVMGKQRLDELLI